jgi:WD40 repeat protein
MEFAATILEKPSLGMFPSAAVSPCGTSFAVTSCDASGINWELALFDLGTMAKTQSMVLAAGNIDFALIAMSPDGKSLATTDTTGGIQLYESHDLTIQKYVDTKGQRSDEAVERRPVAFDPTSRVFAVGRFDGSVELRTI